MVVEGIKIRYNFESGPFLRKKAEQNKIEIGKSVE